MYIALSNYKQGNVVAREVDYIVSAIVCIVVTLHLVIFSCCVVYYSSGVFCHQMQL